MLDELNFVGKRLPSKFLPIGGIMYRIYDTGRTIGTDTDHNLMSSDGNERNFCSATESRTHKTRISEPHGCQIGALFACCTFTTSYNSIPVPALFRCTASFHDAHVRCHLSRTGNHWHWHGRVSPHPSGVSKNQENNLRVATCHECNP